MIIKVLIVASNNSEQPFVMEQMAAISAFGVRCEFFGVSGKGLYGYLNNLSALREKIALFNPDIIHAHYGLSGLLSNLQRKIPVVTTYHGSDIHSNKIILLLSKIAMRLSAYNIFVGQRLFDIAKYRGSNYMIQSCGVNMNVIQSMDAIYARKQMGLDNDKYYILFAGSFDNPIKNSELAKESAKKIENCHLIELKGYSNSEVNLLMNACNLVLITSWRESGPLVVKEAMACGRPIVTTDVGDAKWIIGETQGCYVCRFDANDCAGKIRQAIEFSIKQKKTNGRQRINDICLDNCKVAQRIISVYEFVLSIKRLK
ncbi:MAG: glycosyltransferase family 4 protein [Bacteroidales bacterium]